MRNGQSVSYEEIEALLFGLGFELHVKGSHYVFRKKGYDQNVSIKWRKVLLSYQLKLVAKVLDDHEL